jgi:predicted DsbA family dithiol-disulfide isomerase
MQMKVEVYSDIACPWCYIGKRRFERALAAFPGADRVEVVFRPYQLDPTTPRTPEPLLPRLERKFGARYRDAQRHVNEAAHAEGIAMDYDRALATNTLEAHRLLRLAEREYGAEAQRALADLLFDAYFAQGGDVGDPLQLTELAARAGLDRERVAAYLASDEGRSEVEAEIADARALGVSAVPTFVFDGQWAVEGAQPASTFLQVLERVTSESGSEPVAAGTEVCDDEGCVI